MAPTTSDSADSGRRSSTPAGSSSAPGAITGSSRGKGGTSATQTTTGPATRGRSTAKATGRRQAPKADDGAAGLTAVSAVQRDLDDIAERTAALARSGLAATAVALARELDDVGRDRPNSAHAKSQCANSLRDVLDRLRELAPEKRKGGIVDELRARRDIQVARGPGAAVQVRP